MKAEITRENKQRFFAQHWGQAVLCSDRYGRELVITYFNPSQVLVDGMSGLNYHLELTSLADISDEDAIEVWDLLHPDGGNKHKLTREEVIRQGKDIAESIQYSRSGWMVGLRSVLDIVDFLRSRGYLLPWMGLSCEELIEAGWVKYK